MKKVLIPLILISIFFGCTEQPEKDKEEKDKEETKTTIRGNIDQTRADKIVLEYLHYTDTATVSSNGDFVFYPEIEKPLYAYLRYGDNTITLFVQPNVSTYLETNSREFYENLQFTGGYSEINHYLKVQNVNISNTSINTTDFMYAGDFNTFLTSYRNFKNSLYSIFDEFKKSNLAENEDFFEIEKNRLRAIHLSLIYRYYNSNTSAQGAPGGDLKKELIAQSAGLDINDSSLLQLQEFKELLPYYTDYKLSKKIINENIQINTVGEYAEILFSIIEDEIDDSEVLDYLYFSFLEYLVNNYGIEDMNKYRERYAEISIDSDRVEMISDLFGNWEQLLPGEPSIDFAFPDINGNIYTLDDFKGKFLYIDVWATWCGPCRAEIPHLAELKNKYENTDIEIIGISVDERRSDWENFVVNQQMGGVQLHAGGWDNEFIRFFRITGIPRFILLDQDGNIINSNADRPSGNIEQVLNGLLGV